MSSETNKTHPIQGWRIKDMGRATVEVFGDAGDDPQRQEVRRLGVIALDAAGVAVQDKRGWPVIATVEEDASATTAQMLEAVLRVQKDMLQRYGDGQPGV